MKKISELQVGFFDAENYHKRENKQNFEQIFLRTEALEGILEDNKYFLMGDKGTGKTAIAVYLANNEYKNTTSTLTFIRETVYQKFISLKKEKHLTLSEYVDVWKVIIYLLIAEKLYQSETKAILFGIRSKYKFLKEAIDTFYNKAFSPEIIYALNFVNESKRAAEAVVSGFKLGDEEKNSVTFSENTFQINLMFIQNKFEEAFKSLNLSKNHVLFIDGIDIRPTNVDYAEYLNCIKGLANAVWSLNNTFFANIKDSKGRIKIVLLLRPDIYASMGLQNLNNKIMDNSILLSWNTDYVNYRRSHIFLLIDKMLRTQQNNSNDLKEGDAWDYYFPYTVTSSKDKNNPDNSFIAFLRFSTGKPREIISMIAFLKEIILKDNTRIHHCFTTQDFDNTLFRARYSSYLLGEIKDYLSFYHKEEDYELFIKFYEFLDGKLNFTYEEFMEAYEKFALFVESSNINVPDTFASSDKFLQFLFELNIICYIEDTVDGSAPYIHWCYRERDYANLSPKVKIGVRYQIHYGLNKALNVGTKFKNRIINTNRNIK